MKKTLLLLMLGALQLGAQRTQSAGTIMSGKPIYGQPANGQTPVYNSTTKRFEYGAAAGGSGAVDSVAGKTGAVTLNQSDLSDLAPVRTSSTRITIPAGQGPRFGRKVCPDFSAGTVDIASGTATVYLSVGNDCVLYATSNVVFTAPSGITTLVGSDYPENHFPLGTCPVSSGSVTSCTSTRRAFGTTPILNGANISVTHTADGPVVGVSGVQDGSILRCIGSASTTATCTMSPAPGALVAGMMIVHLPGATNTTTYTLEPNGLGARSVLKHDGTALAAGDVTSGRPVVLLYNGTAFLLPPSGGASTASAVTSTAVGSVAATTVQSAIQELDTEKEPALAFTTPGLGYTFWPYIASLTNGLDVFTSATKTNPQYVQVVLDRAQQVSTIRLRLSAATTGAADGLALAIYDANCNKVVNATSVVVANGTVGNVEFAVSPPVTLPRGTYHYGVATEASTSLNFVQITSWASTHVLYLNQTGAPRGFTGANAATGTGTGLTMPASCGTKTISTYSAILVALLP